ncbi:MAG: DegT/DnrJ/EryC1/StrS family aminotransferase [Planctomyces sp.]
MTWPLSDPDIQSILNEMWFDGSWGQYHGRHAEHLIQQLSEFHQIPHVVLCSSGTCAMELALRGLNVGIGDEVVLCSYDFKSNFMNVVTIGATPVLVDSLPGVPTVDPIQVESAVTEKTRAIICSHLHGCLADIRTLMAIGERRGIAVIEDACQTPGALIGDQRAGALGHVGILSFGGSKLLTSGRGGAVLTQDPAIAQRIRLYVQRGNDAYPLSEMQAAVLLPQLRKLDELNARRHHSVELIAQCIPTDLPWRIAGVSDSRVKSATHGAYYKVPVIPALVEDRAQTERLSHQFRDLQIPLDPGLPALHLTHSRRRFRSLGPLVNAEALHHRLMTLHHPVLLSDDASIQELASQITDIIRNRKIH